MKYNKLLLIIINFTWGIGLKGLLIPGDAVSMACSYSGIADSKSVMVNPANIISQKSSSVSASLNKWLGEIRGNTVFHYWEKNYFYINSYEVNDIELWGNIPGSEPIDNISMRWLTLAYGYGINFKKKYSLGMELKGVYSRLYTDTSRGFVGNLGVIYHLNNKFQFGAVAKNFGFIDSDLDEEFPSEIGFGLAYKFYIPLQFKLDLIKSKSVDMIIRSSVDFDLKFLTLTCGISQYDSNQYISGGFKLDYRQWSISYGILTQEIASLGTPYSIQLTMYY